MAPGGALRRQTSASGSSMSSASSSHSSRSSFDLERSEDEDSLDFERHREVPSADEVSQGLLSKHEGITRQPDSPNRRGFGRLIGAVCSILFVLFIGLIFATAVFPNFSHQEEVDHPSDPVLGIAPPLSSLSSFVAVTPSAFPSTLTQLAQMTSPSPITSSTDGDGQRPPSIHPARKAVVLASFRDQNVDWLTDLAKLTDGWEVFRYVSDDPDTEYLRTPKHLGREAMAYLTFIIDNYDDLPEYVVFTHGDDRSWHQPERMVDNLMALNMTAIEDEQFINLRCGMSPGCTSDTIFHFKPDNPDDKRPGTHIRDGFWATMMSSDFGPLPETISRRCCAQFAVTKGAIERMPLTFWKAFRQPLETDVKTLKEKWGKSIDFYSVGSMYEQVWHIVFGKDPENCPSAEHCRKVYFQDAIRCDGETLKFTPGDESWKDIQCDNTFRQDIPNATNHPTVLV